MSENGVVPGKVINGCNEEFKKKEEKVSSGQKGDPMVELRAVPVSDSPKMPLKSSAVVKYSIVQAPVSFAKLQCNTNLNTPPANWLCSSVTSCGMQPSLSNSSGFSSFRMAHMFPDCVGEVDVVSDAENIKKLLKIPYSKGPVSMMVHRVENTLLIDEFDIHKHLLRAAESEWRWLKRFFFDHVLTSLSCKDKGIYQKNKSRGALQQRSLVSKFLYHSLAEPDKKEGEETKQAPPPSPEETTPPVNWPSLPEHWASLPEPRLELPDPSSKHEFTRNVRWTFEDIQMLIGTDMPIFGGSTHPCISLRLRDMSKPISVLTGIDYWLDNLMCNVPELVMCYHLDGIVQKYELIKTEDLPHLEDSKFSPKLIHDVAQNILSFLKSNATKSGHTYWLFKGKDDDAVKLYDLTSLCTDEMDEKEQNPFTVPVAMLLYRVARNMKQQGSQQHGSIRMLLQHCISLLSPSKHPQIVTSAHYMMADLYVPADTNPSSPDFPQDYEDFEEDIKEEGRDETSVEVKSLYVATPDSASREEYHPPPLGGTTEERCMQALRHVSRGLTYLRALENRAWGSPKSKEKASKSKPETKHQDPKMAQSFQAIPMPYSPLSKNTVVLSSPQKEVKVQQEEAEEWTKGEPDWAGQLLILLYEKALLSMAILTQDSINTQHYGASLSQVHAVLKLSRGLEKLSRQLGIKVGNRADLASMRSYLLGQAGDSTFMLVQHWCRMDQYRSELEYKEKAVEEIMRQLLLDVGEDTDPWRPVSPDVESMEGVLRASIDSYRLALASQPSTEQANSLKRRLGNVHNEMGVLYMTMANTRYNEQECLTEEFEFFVQQSMAEFSAGVLAFENVGDSSNIALLLTNSGRLMRLCAHATSPQMRSPLIGREKAFYNKALAYYQKAQYVLGCRKNNPNIWDNVTWELSTTLFTMATVFQDYPNTYEKSQEELEREVSEQLQKALQACDLETPGPKQAMYQFRAATINHRLASLYHKSFLAQSADEPRRKFTLQLCRLHYDRAADLFVHLEHPTEFLTVQLERVALAEHIAENCSSGNSKRKSLHTALELIVESESLVRLLGQFAAAALAEGKGEGEEGRSGGMVDLKEEMRLARLLEQRLQCILLQLSKLSCQAKTNKKDKEPSSSEKSSGPPYKNMYALTLHRSSGEEDLTSLAERLSSVLAKISTLLPPRQ